MRFITEDIFMKKALAILSVFALLFGFTACKNGLEGGLEGNLEGETTQPAPAFPTVNLQETQLYIDDGNGNTIPVETATDKKGNTIYEYTDADGNKVTQKNDNNLVGVTKYSKEEQAQIHLEQVSKEFQNNPDILLDNSEDIEFVLADGLVPENLFVKTEVELKDGKPVRGDADSYRDIISGDTFTVKMNVKSIMGGVESDIPLSWAKSGNNLLIETSMPVDGKGKAMKVNVLYKDGKCYMILPTTKLYAEIPGDAFGELFNPEIFEQEVEDTNVYKASYNLKVKGKNFSCDVYESKDGLTTTKNYFDNKGNPIRVEIVSGEDVTIWEITQLADKADTALFKVPAGYFDISVIYGSDFDLGLDLGL